MNAKSGKPRASGHRAETRRTERSSDGLEPADPDLRISRARSRGLLGVVLIGAALWLGIIAAVWELIRDYF